ncbi:toll/interleukin-1 receptor domain-containing protein [Leptothrix ochracea]|uniref:toll/interleukin-1 receptor domain-containing protein n=1 Tax=Leptothrix ochracea TaxID=735331 RepID=UPI0034E2CC40
MHPKAFISHASEDKQRFVLPFSERLRAAGIDAWLDRWEMLPGDSLVDKIFEEGLRNASAVVVVLSANSVNKPWVREELNSAFVKRVNSGSKLIPVVLDACDVPEALASTLWERIDDLTAYDESFHRIIAAITGTRDKPPLGPLPAYVTSPIQEIGGLARIDNLVLRAASELAMKNGHDMVNGHDLQSFEFLATVPVQELNDSLEILEQAGIVTVTQLIGMDLPPFRITTYGFQQYAKAYVDGYDDLVGKVALAIVNQKLQDNQAIRAHLNTNQFLVDHAMDVLESQRYIRLSRSIGGHTHIIDVSAALKRALA